ncbi:MAG: hypothetical protein MHMPM18_001280 [Marteilia pararefringens]
MRGCFSAQGRGNNFTNIEKCLFLNIMKEYVSNKCQNKNNPYRMTRNDWQVLHHRFTQTVTTYIGDLGNARSLKNLSIFWKNTKSRLNAYLNQCFEQFLTVNPKIDPKDNDKFYDYCVERCENTNDRLKFLTLTNFPHIFNNYWFGIKFNKKHTRP